MGEDIKSCQLRNEVEAPFYRPIVRDLSPAPDDALLVARFNKTVARTATRDPFRNCHF